MTRNNSGPDIAGYLPLKPTVFTILMVLADGMAHGYGIKKDVEQRSDGRIRLEPGTLYRLIGKLLDDGFIEEAPGSNRATEDDERRRYYRLRPLGRKVLVAETERLAAMIDAARAKRLIPTAGPS